MSNLRHFVLLLSILYIFSTNASAASQGQGRVHVRGSIVETPCAIATESRFQNVDIGVTPDSMVARDGRSMPHLFYIRLVNCKLDRLKPGDPAWHYFQLTFNGKDDNGFFALNSGVNGIALQLEDSQGNIAHPNQPLPVSEITPGNMKLGYSLRLVGNHHAMQVGSFHSDLQFMMNYY
ncbi:TPA: type 1 fimbrial protein [Enterobacter roggenkampii]|nr:type 1 fimbrial protein [Enterobacter roggenkampii]